MVSLLQDCTLLMAVFMFYDFYMKISYVHIMKFITERITSRYGRTTSLTPCTQDSKIDVRVLKHSSKRNEICIHVE